MTPAGNSIDASGGWLDAGDYLKFVETVSYVTDLMLAGLRDFPQAMQGFRDEARFGVDWLMKMWDDTSQTLYLQVGLRERQRRRHRRSRHLAFATSRRHLWRVGRCGTQYIRHRPVFMAGPAGSPVSPTCRGRLAAAFAECYAGFPQFGSSYAAAACLLAAEHIFASSERIAANSAGHHCALRFLSRDGMARRYELGARELDFALRALARSICHRGFRTPILFSIYGLLGTGPTRIYRARMMAPTRSTSTTSAGLRITSSIVPCKRIRARCWR